MERRHGTARQCLDDMVRKAFEVNYMDSSTGRWSVEKLKQDLSKAEGIRAEATRLAGGGAAMHVG